jgi:hypothetical protein
MSRWNRRLCKVEGCGKQNGCGQKRKGGKTVLSENAALRRKKRDSTEFPNTSPNIKTAYPNKRGALRGIR